MGKVFGYPEFDANGEKILTTYDNEYKDMMMDIRVYRMKAGETRSFKRDSGTSALWKHHLCMGRQQRDGQQKRRVHRGSLVRPCVYWN